MNRIVLHQFPYSHFNDKARWALAYKQVSHERESYLPGPHIPAIRKLSGQPQTPVLAWGDEIVAGSAAIIDFLETAVPARPLYPSDRDAARTALDWQSRFDQDVGPAVRTALFSVLIDEPDYLCGMFATGKGALKRFLYRRSFPLARPLIAKGNGVDSDDSIARAFDRTTQALDEVASATAATGYLVRDTFSVADLAVAALLAPLCDPPIVDMARPRPRPTTFNAFLERYASHPACAWVGKMYRDHRTG